jgi:hypothetical protein
MTTTAILKNDSQFSSSQCRNAKKKLFKTILDNEVRLDDGVLACWLAG